MILVKFDTKIVSHGHETQKNFCHFWTNFAHIPMLRNLGTGVIIPVFDLFTPSSPRKELYDLKIGSDAYLWS